VADYCGLSSGIPLVAGAGDKPAAYLAAGMVEPGAMIDEAGSFSAFSLCTDRFVPDAGHRTLEIFPSAIEGLYYPTMILLGSGTAHRWVTDLFTPGVDASGQSSCEGGYAHLDRLAAGLPPGSENLIAVGLLSGSGYPPEPDIRGVWAGFSFHHRREHFYRAILESYAYEYAKAFTIMKETYEELTFRKIRVTGGGSKSSLWNRIKSDVLGCALCEVSRSDLTLLGNVMLAGTGVGIYPDLVGTVRRFTSSKREVLPDQENHVRYTKYIALYTSLLDKLQPFFRELKGNA
jgi:xylulokinase